MTHKLKTEMFSQKIEYSGGVFFWPLTPLFSFVSFHLNVKKENIRTRRFHISIFTLLCLRSLLEGGFSRITTL